MEQSKYIIQTIVLKKYNENRAHIGGESTLIFDINSF